MATSGSIKSEILKLLSRVDFGHIGFLIVFYLTQCITYLLFRPSLNKLFSLNNNMFLSCDRCVGFAFVYLLLLLELVEWSSLSQFHQFNTAL